MLQPCMSIEWIVVDAGWKEHPRYQRTLGCRRLHVAADSAIRSPIQFAMHRTFGVCLIVVTIAAAASAGCSGPNELVASQGAELDSVYAVNRDLQERLIALGDSLQFYSDIESGQYYRDRRMLTQEIEKLQYEVSVCRDGGRTIEMLSVDALFVPASAILTDAGRTRIDAMADTLKSRHAGDIIRIEGHADSTPVGSRLEATYPSNWELSAARAAAIVRYLVDEHDLPTGQIEVASYGSTRPIARNDTAEGRRENRRIRVAVVVR